MGNLFDRLKFNIPIDKTFVQSKIVPMYQNNVNQQDVNTWYDDLTKRSAMMANQLIGNQKINSQGLEQGVYQVKNFGQFNGTFGNAYDFNKWLDKFRTLDYDNIVENANDYRSKLNGNEEFQFDNANGSTESYNLKDILETFNKNSKDWLKANAATVTINNSNGSSIVGGTFNWEPNPIRIWHLLGRNLLNKIAPNVYDNLVLADRDVFGKLSIGEHERPQGTQHVNTQWTSSINDPMTTFYHELGHIPQNFYTTLNEQNIRSLQGSDVNTHDRSKHELIAIGKEFKDWVSINYFRDKNGNPTLTNTGTSFEIKTPQDFDNASKLTEQVLPMIPKPNYLFNFFRSNNTKFNDQMKNALRLLTPGISYKEQQGQKNLYGNYA